MASYLMNGCLQFIEALIAVYFYQNVSCENKNKFKNAIIIILSYVLMWIVNIKFDYNAVLNIIILTFAHFIFSHFLLKQNISVSIFYPLLFVVVVTLTEISAMYLISVVSKNEFGGYKNSIGQYSLLIILSKSLLFFTFKIISDIIKKVKTNIKIRYVYLIYPISLIIILFVFNFISIEYNFSDNIKVMLAISSVIMLFSIIITCILQQQSAQKEYELIELKAIQQKQDIESTYFDLLEHQNEELQIFVHDMKKHLVNIYELSNQNESTKSYIKELVYDLEESNKIGKTSNKLLDIIIDKYDYICKKENICFEKNIHTSDISFISDSDLTSIFNNLLDNAIEAARKSKDKTIELSVNTVDNNLMIDISNSCDSPPIVRNNVLLSTKKDDGLHGYGFKSVKKSIKKYNGDLEWDYDNNIFNISILFSL